MDDGLHLAQSDSNNSRRLLDLVLAPIFILNDDEVPTEGETVVLEMLRLFERFPGDVPGGADIDHAGHVGHGTCTNNSRILPVKLVDEGEEGVDFERPRDFVDESERESHEIGVLREFTIG